MNNNAINSARGVISVTLRDFLFDDIKNIATAFSTSKSYLVVVMIAQVIRLT